MPLRVNRFPLKDRDFKCAQEFVGIGSNHSLASYQSPDAQSSSRIHRLIRTSYRPISSAVCRLLVEGAAGRVLPSLSWTTLRTKQHWPLRDQSNVYWKEDMVIVDGTYRWEVTALIGVTARISSNTPVASDFELQAELGLVRGKNTLYGFYFRQSDEGGYYFLIDDKGGYGLNAGVRRVAKSETGFLGLPHRRLGRTRATVLG